MYTRGCRGSTAVQAMARRLLEAHGFRYSPVPFEDSKVEYSVFRRDGLSAADAFRKQEELSQAAGDEVLFLRTVPKIYSHSDWQPHEYLDASSGGPFLPLLMYTRGCRGSTAVQAMARRLLEAHGFRYSPVPFENSKVEYNVFRRDGLSAADAFRKQVELSQAAGEVLFFKYTEPTLEARRTAGNHRLLRLLLLLFAAVAGCSAALLAGKPRVATLKRREGTVPKIYSHSDWQPHEYLDASSGGPFPPLLMYTRGCRGSTAVQAMARRLLEAHGFRYSPVPFENSKVEYNVFRQDGLSAADAFRKQVELSQAAGEVLFFKYTEPTLEEKAALRARGEEAFDVQKEMGTRMVHVRRANALDKVVCAVRDCFQHIPDGEQAGRAGGSVDAEGVPNSLCFKRRLPGSPKTYANLNVSRIADEMSAHLRVEQQDFHKLQRAGFRQADSYATEDLMAFMFNKDHVRRSLMAWKGFFEALGVKADADVILATWAGGCDGACIVGSRPQSPHRTVIYNYDDVAAALLASGNSTLWQMLRQGPMPEEV
eukprot:jgi/Tetstr1/424807/TSEL_015310.t1